MYILVTEVLASLAELRRHGSYKIYGIFEIHLSTFWGDLAPSSRQGRNELRLDTSPKSQARRSAILAQLSDYCVLNIVREYYTGRARWQTHVVRLFIIHYMYRENPIKPS
jgi:hypothetical protein